MLWASASPAEVPGAAVVCVSGVETAAGDGLLVAVGDDIIEVSSGVPWLLTHQRAPIAITSTTTAIQPAAPPPFPAGLLRRGKDFLAYE